MCIRDSSRASSIPDVSMLPNLWLTPTTDTKLDRLNSSYCSCLLYTSFPTQTGIQTEHNKQIWRKSLDCIQKHGYLPVSYTHLDVYKRQIFTIIYEHFYFRLRINSCMNTNSVFFIGCNLQEWIASPEDILSDTISGSPSHSKCTTISKSFLFWIVKAPVLDITFESA